jgi:hypothetical protein
MSHSAGGAGSDGKSPGARAKKSFDLRFLIGGLFTLYGLMVGGAGLFDSTSDLKKSDGLRINLWTGLGMLVLGLLFLLWAYLRPLPAVDRSGAGSEEKDTGS